MYAQGLDMVGASLQRLDEVARFEARHWARHPWMKDVARRVRDRLDHAD
jgi:3-isopropylmalate/(R)-2-methylmalate dehydratase small subunit